MKNTFHTLLILISFLSSQTAYSQSYPQGYFRKPLDIPLVLSGTFGELRSNHFHSGIDIKTQGRMGLKVYAAADGYISRIKISPWGYGNALYIKHPNGYTTVYGHMLHFNKKLDSIIKSVQYSRKSFAVEYYPKANQIPIQKGEVIGFSGNSGGSGGPHLHFEIRDAAERPCNAFLFGIKVPDNIKPTIKALKIYLLPYDSYSNTLQKEYKFSSKRKPLSLNDTIIVTPNFYVGINSYDKLNGASNKNGIYTYSVYVDGKLHFNFTAEKIVFSEKRYINSYIDFKELYENRDRFQRSYVEPGNKLSVYKKKVNSGIINLKDSLAHQIKIETKDYAGNSNSMEFYVQNGPVKTPKIHYPAPNFKYTQQNLYRIENAKVSFPIGSFYDDIYFTMSSLKNIYNSYSQLIRVGNPEIPLHKYAQLSIKADSNLTPNLYAKAAIASLSKNKRLIYEGGKYSNGWVNTKTRSFGDYFIVVDTIAPRVKAENVYNGKYVTNQKSLDFIITDNLSGINKYIGTVDGKWVLGQYDPKKSRLSFPIDEHYPKGSFKFKLIIRDAKGNSKVVNYTLKKSR